MKSVQQSFPPPDGDPPQDSARASGVLLPSKGGGFPSVSVKAPSFQFYASDFLASTSEMTAEEVGAYIRLLCHQWLKGGLPNDQTRLAAMVGTCGGNAMAYAVAKFGMCQDGLLRQGRLEEIRAKQEEYRQKQAKNAQKRWVGNSMAMPSHMPNACSPSPSPSPNVYQTQPKPTLEQAKELAGMRNILPEVVEAWWHECESVGWIDGKSRPIGNWQSALVSYATKWTANARKAPPGGNPAQRRGPVVHTAEDYEKGF